MKSIRKHEVVLSRRWCLALLLPIISGIAASLCFPPYQITSCVWVCLIPFAIACRFHSNFGTVLYGSAIASSLFAGLVLRFLEHIEEHTGTLQSQLVGLWCFATLLSIWVWPLAFIFTRWLHLNLKFPFGVSFATAWILSEALRQGMTSLLLQSPCPWMHFGYTLARCEAMLPIGSLGGITLISFITSLVNATIAEVVVTKMRPGAILWLLVTVFALGLLVRLTTLDDSHKLPPHRTLVVVLVPDPIAWQDFRTIRQTVAQLEPSIEHADELLVVGPEQGLPSISIETTQAGSIDLLNHIADGSISLTPAIQLSQKLACDVIVGATLITQRPDERVKSNCALHISNGDLVAMRHKKILVPFAEFIPDVFQRVLFDSIFSLQDMLPGFAAGKDNTVFELASSKTKVLPLICYDSAVSYEMAGYAEEPDLIVQIGSEPNGKGKAVQDWMQNMAIMRAIESGRYVVRCVNNGYNCVIDPGGHLLAASYGVNRKSRVLMFNVSLAKRDTLIAKFGNWPLVLVLIASGIVTGLRSRARRKRPR